MFKGCGCEQWARGPVSWSTLRKRVSLLGEGSKGTNPNRHEDIYAPMSGFKLRKYKKNEKEHSTQTKIRFQTVRSCWGRWQFGAHNCPAQGDFLSSGVSPHLEKKRNAVGCRVASWSTTREFHNPKHLQKLEPQNSAPAGPAGALSLFLSFCLPFPFLYSRCYDDRRQQDAVITSRNKCIYVYIYIYIYIYVYAFICLFFIFLFIYLFNLFIDFLFKSIYLFVYLLSF